MSNPEVKIKIRGRPKEHKDITVSQVDSNADYHKQYYHKVLKRGRVKTREPFDASEETTHEKEKEN